MYLHLGQTAVVRGADVIGVFDLDNASWSHRTRAFLNRAEKEARVVNACADLPRSFVLCGGRGRGQVYLSQFYPGTLKGRLEEGF